MSSPTTETNNTVEGLAVNLAQVVSPTLRHDQSKPDDTLARVTSQRDRLFKGLTQYIGATTRDQMIEMRGVVKALQKKEEQVEALALIELCLEIYTEIHANENQQPTQPTPTNSSS